MPGGELNEEALQLVRFLRDLTRSRRTRILDFAGYDEVHWLADLPGEVTVRADAMAGDSRELFSIPVIPLNPPSALEDFDGWLALRRWYRTLRALATVPVDRELILAVGLLTWTSADGVAVRNHLLSTPVRVHVDPQTERVHVVMTDRPTALQDRDLLEDLAGFRPARTDWLRDAVRSGQGTGLQDSVADVLRKWCGFAFDEPIPFREDWTDDLAGGVTAGASPGSGSPPRWSCARAARPRSSTTSTAWWPSSTTATCRPGWPGSCVRAPTTGSLTSGTGRRSVTCSPRCSPGASGSWSPRPPPRRSTTPCRPS